MASTETTLGEDRFFALTLDLLTVVGFDGWFKRLNAAWERELGWTTAELTSRPYADFIHPEDRERTLAEAARLATPGAETRDFELRFQAKAGDYRWLLFSAQGSPEEQLIYAVGKDITRRKLTERYVRAQHAVDRVLVESPSIDDAIPQVLAALGETMGWAAGGFWALSEDEDCLRCRVFWAADPERVREFSEHSRDAVRQRGQGLPGRVLASGEAEWVTDVATDPNFPRAEVAARAGLHGAMALPLVSGGGQIMAVMDFFADELRDPDEELMRMMRTISAHVGQFIRRRQAEEALSATAAELRRRADELERSNAELEQFAYVASHDLSEPLRMISGFVQLLAERYRGRLDADADEFIGYTVDGVERMQSLINDLLAYSRVGRATHDGPVELGQVLDDVLSSLRAPLDERGAQVEVGELPVVHGDRRELTQLFQNLVSNAVKFVDGAPPRVEVRAQPAADAWAVSVRDNGIGVDPAHAERIFKMFQRLHGRDEYPGTGIGLAICKKIVERHGGHLDVAPADGGGSVFTVVLPAGAEGVA